MVIEPSCITREILQFHLAVLIGIGLSGNLYDVHKSSYFWQLRSVDM